MLCRKSLSLRASNVRLRDEWWYPYLWWLVFTASMLVTITIAGCPQL